MYGSSGLYPIGGYLRRHQGTKNCGINFVDINEWNSDEERNRVCNSAKKRLIHPFSRIRDVYSDSQIKNISVNEDGRWHLTDMLLLYRPRKDHLLVVLHRAFCGFNHDTSG